MHREVMRRFLVALALAAAFGVPAAQALEQRAGDQRVTVQVVPTRPALQALRSLPMPPDTRPVTADAFGGSFRHAGQSGGVARFFLETLPARGYRLVHRGDDGWLVWERADVRLQLRIQAVLGQVPETRIVVQASTRGGQVSRGIGPPK